MQRQLMRNVFVVSALAAVIATTAFVAAPPGASAEAPNDVFASGNAKTYTEPNGVVHYVFEPERMPGNRVRTVKGVRQEDGSCTFAQSGSGSVAENAKTGGPKVTVSLEITFDPATCVSEYAEATYLAAATPESVRKDFESNDGMLGDGVGTVDENEAAVASSWYGAINGVHKDPIPATVTKTEASLHWGTSGATSHWNGYYYLSGTGWSMPYYSPVNTSSYTNTRANFKNTLFCNPFASTYTNHTRDEFRGYTSGSWHWYWTHSKSGDCSSLLNSGYYLETP